MVPTIFVSDAVGHERLDIAQHGSPEPASGWKALSLLYQGSFAACGFRLERVLRPEIYQTDRARALLGVRTGDWHLAVKPMEHLRPFHGVPNAFVCDWPFPELSSEVLGGSPFFDQVRLLRQADVVLCPTSFTTDTLRRAGVERAVTLPPHIVAHAGFAAGTGPDGAERRFLCVVEAASLPRQLGPAIEGFTRAASRRGGLHLLVRLRGGGNEDVAALRRKAVQLVDELGSAPAVTVESETGAGAEEGARTHFFLSAHAAPGLHVPLVEAMAAGLVPVATLTAGTASFLPPEAAVPVEARADTLDGQGEPIGRFMPLTSNPPTAEAVKNAVLAAAALDEATRARIAALARDTAERRFGLAAFKEGLACLGAMLPGVQR